MSLTYAPPATSAGAPGTEPTRRVPAGDISNRAAGLGALGFAGVVVLQNILRASAPQPGADLDDVVRHFADHRALTVTLTATFVVGLCSLALFIGGTLRRLAATDRRGWAVLGAFGACTLVALFAGVLASEQALSVVAVGKAPDMGAVQALWNLHNSVFTVNLLFIGIALVGLSRAGIAADITPRPFRVLAPVGAGLLTVGTLSGPYIANGEAMPLFGVSVIGFVVWLAFLATTGRRLIRSEAA